MAVKMKLIAAISLIGTAAMAVCYKLTSVEILLSLAITFGTIAYHLTMRLLVGLVFDIVMKNKADCQKRWYRVSKGEVKVYEKLKVKKWKNKLPTYDKSVFDPKLHTWNEIAQAMCQAELVHETIAVLSFLPIFAGAWFGAYPVFIITSVLSAVFDMLFVVMQRYNRQRVIRLMKRENAAI